ncbi:DedA family protein [Streptacidiphilus sp. PB12-B1b]|uniref:DedA family protein n=1 Tax=Streptacidiphilus sp. PB12-B1b TaxID=2705012 RepID=UPI0015FC9934|nr:DedA family protein [Streptacidiphilus sp. PB12-B1b]QMU74715.1 DedA family protein [Streptacidiphilus sp. PB12-B1b]
MQHFIASYGVIAVFLLMTAESACIPIPSELVMLFGGALSAGAVPGAHPALVWVFAAGVAGNLTGSFLAWAVGRYAGPAAVRRFGRYVWLREHDLDRAQDWFARHGAASVFLGRMLPVVRTFISLPAGIAAMPPLRFGFYTAAGCVPFIGILASVGSAVGTHWQTIADDFHGPTYAIAALLAAALACATVLHTRRHRNQPRHAAPTTGSRQ